MLGVETFGEDLVEGEHRRGIIPRPESIHQPEGILVVQDIEIADHILIMDIRAAESHGLVEDGKRVAHGTVGLLGDDVERLIVDGDILLSGDVAEVLHDIGYADAVEVIGLAAGQDRWQDLVLLGSRKDEDRMCRRLLQGLEESIESSL